MKILLTMYYFIALVRLSEFTENYNLCSSSFGDVRKKQYLCRRVGMACDMLTF